MHAMRAVFAMEPDGAPEVGKLDGAWKPHSAGTKTQPVKQAPFLAMTAAHVATGCSGDCIVGERGVLLVLRETFFFVLFKPCRRFDEPELCQISANVLAASSPPDNRRWLLRDG